MAYLEGAKKQACKYAVNALCYRCFSRNVAKIGLNNYFNELFRCVESKSRWSIHPVVLFNPSMLVVPNGHIYLKQTWKS